MLVSRYTETPNQVVMGRVIASSLLADLDSPNGNGAEPIGVHNMLRLLKMYDTDTFYTHDPLGILEQDDFADLNHLRESDDSSRLKESLKATHEAFSPELSTGDFAHRVSDLLEKLLVKTASAEDLADIKRFLSNLTNALA